MSTIGNKLDALFAMGYSADEIAHIAREQEQERNAAMNIAARAKARNEVIKAFDAYNKVLGIDEPVPAEVWTEVFDDYEYGVQMIMDHGDELREALDALADLFGSDDTREDKEESANDWVVISEDELKEELKRKVKEFCDNKYN